MRILFVTPCYGDVVLVDTTFATNLFRLPLLAFDLSVDVLLNIIWVVRVLCTMSAGSTLLVALRYGRGVRQSGNQGHFAPKQSPQWIEYLQD